MNREDKQKLVLLRRLKKNLTKIPRLAGEAIDAYNGFGTPFTHQVVNRRLVQINELACEVLNALAIILYKNNNQKESK